MTSGAGISASAGYQLEEAAPATLADEWDDLAARCGSPYLTTAWLMPWTTAYAPRARWLVLRTGTGRLAATGCFMPLAGGGLAAAANIETSHWDVAAVDSTAREEMWRRVATLAGSRLRLSALPDGSSLDVLRRVLPAAGFRVLEWPGPANPLLQLPPTWDELLATVSHNLRAQYRRKLRALATTGSVRLRITTGGPDFDRDLQTFLRLEASGWKGRLGTAVLRDPAAETLYRGFAERAAGRGWLRLILLERDGQVLAGDLSCAFAGGAFMLKTAYDERLGGSSPGLVLRGEAMRAAIEEGSTFYDFTGGPDTYKLRWGSSAQPYVDVAAYRGLYAPVALYHQRLRPVLKSAWYRLR